MKYPYRYEEIELDKIPKGWVLTAWPRGTKSLFFRLRLTELFDVWDPFRIACEVRLPGCTEFEPITEFEAWGHELLSVDGRAEGWSELPPSLRPEFLTMARTLGAVLRLTPLAGTTEERYPGEPLTSRDYLRFGSADDLLEGAWRVTPAR